jgi:hypothetical protein
MTPHLVKISKNVILCIPQRFMKSEKTKATYRMLIMIFQNVFRNHGSIMSFLNKIQKQTEFEESFMIRLLNFKKSVMDCRRKYVLATWKSKDSERLYNEMTTDVSNLLKESNEIGPLFRQIKTSRK